MATGPNQASTTRRISKTFDFGLDVAAGETTGIAAIFPTTGGINVGGGRFRARLIVDVTAFPADTTLLEVVVDSVAAMTSVKVLDTLLIDQAGTYVLSIDFARDEVMSSIETFVALRVSPVGDTITLNARITKSDNDPT